ncbi:MAG: lycopene cyclase domain-containing protein [Cytophagaceae bacterium]
MYLYLLINVLSIILPLIFSFAGKEKFKYEWKPLFAGIAIMAFIFIPWDIYFTGNGVWGFNNRYITGIKYFHLPLEEWLFFICIPYASLFIHFIIATYLPTINLNKQTTRYLAVIQILICFLIAISNTEKLYTFYVLTLTSLLTFMSVIFAFSVLQRFYISFLFILIPFLIVNGVLTGSFIEGEVVWYNDFHNLGIRIFTIPVEDSMYAFSMLLIPAIMMEKAKTFKKSGWSMKSLII